MFVFKDKDCLYREWYYESHEKLETIILEFTVHAKVFHLSTVFDNFLFYPKHWSL